jgi:hypothetical protein
VGLVFGSGDSSDKSSLRTIRNRPWRRGTDSDERRVILGSPAEINFSRVWIIVAVVCE